MNKRIYRVLFKFMVASVFILAELISPRMENFVSEKLGVFSFMLPLYFILSAVVDMLKDKKMRILYMTRLAFFYLSAFVLTNLLVFIVQSGGEKDSFIDIALNKNNYGEYLTTIFYYLDFKLGRDAVFAVSGTVLFLSIFIFFGRLMGGFVRHTRYCLSKVGREERREKKLKKLRAKKIKKSLREKHREMKKLSKVKSRAASQKPESLSSIGAQEKAESAVVVNEDIIEAPEATVQTQAEDINLDLIEASRVESTYILSEKEENLDESVGIEEKEVQKKVGKVSYEDELDSIIDDLENSGEKPALKESPEKIAKDKFLSGKDECYAMAYEIIEKDRKISVVKLQGKLKVGYQKAKQIYIEISEELGSNDTSI